MPLFKWLGFSDANKAEALEEIVFSNIAALLFFLGKGLVYPLIEERLSHPSASKLLKGMDFFEIVFVQGILAFLLVMALAYMAKRAWKRFRGD